MSGGNLMNCPIILLLIIELYFHNNLILGSINQFLISVDKSAKILIY